MTKQNSNTDTKSAKKLAAATAAATALYLGAAPAQADLVVNDTGLGPFTGGTTGSFWDIDGDGTNEFNIGVTEGVMQGPFSAPFTIYWADATDPFNVGMVQANGDNIQSFRNLPVGFTVGPTLPGGYTFNGGAFQFRVASASGAPYRAQGFPDGGVGYVGFQFAISGQIHYGWAEVIFDFANDNSHSLEITRWAYDDEAGRAVQAGVVPEPATGGLAALAMGMAGLIRWRRKK